MNNLLGGGGLSPAVFCFWRCFFVNYELTVVTGLQYVAHYVADIIHNFPDFLSFLRWAVSSYTSLLSFLPTNLAHISFFGVSSAFLVRLVKF